MSGESIFWRLQMKQSTGLKCIFRKEGIALGFSFIRLSLFMLSVPILLLAIQGMGGENGMADEKGMAKASNDAANRENEAGRSAGPGPNPVPTPSVAEGPYFKSGSPERRSLLEPEVVGDRINLTGQVLTGSGEPVAGALIDFWQADGNGAYDNIGYRLRGHQFTDEQGRYQLETVLPGNYGGRTRHIHVKVRAPDGAVLTTQLFFPGEDNNQRDSLFNPELLVSVNETEAGQVATFDFILDME
jgi:protocatechuate 3,4-dioxygenase beta subunit